MISHSQFTPPPSAGLPEDAGRWLRQGFYRWRPPLTAGPAGIEELPARRTLTMGRYELLGLLGEGGAARVYLAQRLVQPGHRLAVKVFAEEFSIDPAERGVLEAIAREAERLRVGALVRLYEIGESDGRLFVAMERIHGWSLLELRAQCPYGLPDRVSSAVRRQVVAGLHPGNVMVTVEGTVKVLDLASAPQFRAGRCASRPRVRAGDARLLREWIAHMEPRLPPLAMPGAWRGHPPR
jgi:hypothetical protein